MPATSSQLLLRYIASIQAQRGDYNGRVLSIRQDDLRTLAVMYDRRPSQLAEELIAWGVLNPGAQVTLDETRSTAPAHAAAPLAPAQRSASPAMDQIPG